MMEHRREESISDDLWDLYQRSFSEEEKIPKDSMLKAMAEGGTLTSYHDDGFVGLTFHYTAEDRVFFVYLATVPERRNRGYGVQILDRMREMNPGKRIFLVLEPCDSSADDYEMRVRRNRFYQRNGCVPTGVQVLSDDYWFDTMFVQGELTADEMRSTIIEYESTYRRRG